MYLNVSTGGTIFSSFDIETMERRPSPVLPPPTVAKQNARKHHAFRLERRARARPSEHLVPPALQRPSGACASGEAPGGAQAPSDVKVALGTALVAIKSALAAVLAAQLTEGNRSAQIVAMPAWTSYGEQVFACPGEVSTSQSLLQELFDNCDAAATAKAAAEAAMGSQPSGSYAWVSGATAQSSAEQSLVGLHSGVWAWTSSDTAKKADGATGSERDKFSEQREQQGEKSAEQQQGNVKGEKSKGEKSEEQRKPSVEQQQDDVKGETRAEQQQGDVQGEKSKGEKSEEQRKPSVEQQTSELAQ